MSTPGTQPIQTRSTEPASCCGPSRADSAPAGATGGEADVPARAPAVKSDRSVAPEMVSLEGGVFLMGSEGDECVLADHEGPVREVQVQGFSIDPCAVSNLRFAAFVDATGYVTDAERYGWSFTFGGLLPDEFPDTRGAVQAPWWRQVFGAYWGQPEGPHSSIEERLDHPVVQVSWRDAEAFCRWSDVRLPSEIEWEYAARGGLVQRRFPWGDELEPAGEHGMNVWQGTFPSENTLADGFLGTCPVDAFAANDYGLHNMSGNVWEWCRDPFFPDRGPTSNAPDPNKAGGEEARATRGGSYLCHDSYCNRYRVAARSSNTANSSTGNTGFRCARDVDQTARTKESKR
jgi:formylglycine-generating enzyme